MSKAKYTSVFKQECVDAILHGEDSVDDIAKIQPFRPESTQKPD